MVMSQIYHKISQDANNVSELVLTRYIKDPINYMYIMGSIKSEYEVESLNLFRFVFYHRCSHGIVVHHIKSHKYPLNEEDLIGSRHTSNTKSTSGHDPPSLTLRPTPSVTIVIPTIQSPSLATPYVTEKNSIPIPLDWMPPLSLYQDLLKQVYPPRRSHTS
jgi:hypothetical protein